MKQTINKKEMEVPEGWSLVRIGRLTNTTAGGTPSTRIKEYWGGEIPWMNSGELNLKKVYDVKGRITKLGLNNSSTKVIPAKSVLIGLAGQGKTRGTVAMNLIELCINQSIAAILPNGKFYEEYLYYNLDYRYNELRQLSTGDGGRGGLNLSIINSLLLPLPPLSEQKAIAQVLTTADKNIALTDRLIEQKEKQKKWLMQMLLNEKLIIKNEKLYKSGIKRISLKEVAKVIMGQSPHSEAYNTESEGLPLIQGNADIENRRQIIRYWTTESHKECDKNDIIMTVRAPVGAISLALHRSSIGRGVCCIKPKLINHWYLYYLLIHKETAWKKFEQGSTFTAISSKDIFNFSFFIVNSIEEQTAIANILQTADKEIEILKAKAEQLRLQKKWLMQVLLTGTLRLRTVSLTK